MHHMEFSFKNIVHLLISPLKFLSYSLLFLFTTTTDKRFSNCHVDTSLCLILPFLYPLFRAYGRIITSTLETKEIVASSLVNTKLVFIESSPAKKIILE